MRKTQIQIEVVSVEEAKRILKQEQLLAKRNGNRNGKRKLVVAKKSWKYSGRPRKKSTKREVLTS